jgi:hypothetical protein
MKTTDYAKTLAGLVLIAFVFLGGCGLIPGFDSSKAQAIAEKRSSELQEIADKVAGIELAVIDARDAYEEAQRTGDEKAIFQAGQVLIQKIAEQDLSKEDLKNAQKAAESAIQDFKDAKGAGGYLNVVLGSIGGILSMLGIGVPQIQKRDDALAITAASIDTALDDKSAGAFKAAQVDAFKSNPGALKALNKARGK